MVNSGYTRLGLLSGIPRRSGNRSREQCEKPLTQQASGKKELGERNESFHSLIRCHMTVMTGGGNGSVISRSFVTIILIKLQNG